MTKIVRNDRGLDHSRIKYIIEMITNKINDIKYDRRDILEDRKKELKEEAIASFNLQGHYEVIETFDNDIKELEEKIERVKKKQEPHKIAIAKYVRGSDDIYSYDYVRDGSPVDEYINKRIPDIKNIRNNLNLLEEEMKEKLWLAKDIDEARDLYYYAMAKIDEISKVK